MNANELAQEFEEYLKEIEELPWGNHQILCDQAATMLRQQQAEIEALKKKLIMEEESYILLDEECLFAKEAIKLHQAEIKALKAKTLTDEEILSVIDECNLSFYQPQAYMPFARAILRKAQEK